MIDYRIEEKKKYFFLFRIFNKLVISIFFSFILSHSSPSKKKGKIGLEQINQYQITVFMHFS